MFVRLSKVGQRRVIKQEVESDFNFDENVVCVY